jgi:hypothetical protein
MAPGDQAPEQLIRRWLDEHGSATVGMGALAQSWSLESLEGADRREIAAALREAGVVVDPPLETADSEDKLALRVADPAGEATPAGEASPGPESDSVGLTAHMAVNPTEEGEPAKTAPEIELEPPPGLEPDAPKRARREQSGKPGARREVPLAMRLVPVALALMVFGSLGPWARDIFVTDYGIDRDGYVILAIALATGLLLAVHARGGKRSPLPLAAALLATAALVILAADFRELVDDGFVSPAWGLYLAFAGSAALVALSMALLTERR